MAPIIFDVSSLTGLLGICQCVFTFYFFCYDEHYEHDDSQVIGWAAGCFFSSLLLIFGGGLAMRELRETKRVNRSPFGCIAMTICVAISLAVHYWVSLNAQMFVNQLDRSQGKDLLGDVQVMRILHNYFLKRYKTYGCTISYNPPRSARIQVPVVATPAPPWEGDVICGAAHIQVFTNRFAEWFEKLCNQRSGPDYDRCVNIDTKTWGQRSNGPNPFWKAKTSKKHSDLKVVGVGIVDVESAMEYQHFPLLRLNATGTYGHACKSGKGSPGADDPYTLLYRVDDHPLEPTFVSFKRNSKGDQPLCRLTFTLSSVIFEDQSDRSHDNCPQIEIKNKKFLKVNQNGISHEVKFRNYDGVYLTFTNDKEAWAYNGFSLEKCGAITVRIDSGDWSFMRDSDDEFAGLKNYQAHTNGNMSTNGNKSTNPHKTDLTSMHEVTKLRVIASQERRADIFGVFSSLTELSNQEVVFVNEQVYGNSDGWRFKKDEEYVRVPYVGEMVDSKYNHEELEKGRVDAKFITPSGLHYRTNLLIGAKVPPVVRERFEDPQKTYDLVYHLSGGWYQAVPHRNFIYNCTLADDTESMCVYYWNETQAEAHNVTIVTKNMSTSSHDGETHLEHKMQVIITLDFDQLGHFNYTLIPSEPPRKPLSIDEIAKIKTLANFTKYVEPEAFKAGARKKYTLANGPDFRVVNDMSCLDDIHEPKSISGLQYENECRKACAKDLDCAGFDFPSCVLYFASKTGDNPEIVPTKKKSGVDCFVKNPASYFVKKSDPFEPHYYKLVNAEGHFAPNNTHLAAVCPECVGISAGKKCLPFLHGDHPSEEMLSRKPYSYLEWNGTDWKHYILRYCIGSNYQKPGWPDREHGDYTLAFTGKCKKNNADPKEYCPVMYATWGKLRLQGDETDPNRTVWPNSGRVGKYLPAFVSEFSNKVFCKVFEHFAEVMKDKADQLIKWVLSFMVLEGSTWLWYVFLFVRHKRFVFRQK